MRRSAALAVALGVAVAAPLAPLAAQARASGDGFVVGRPGASLSVHGGFARASAGSDVFSYTAELLTVDERDFDGATLGADLGFMLASRTELVLGFSYASRTAASEFRDWVDNDDRPIEQTTELSRVPVMASVRQYLMPRGHAVGRLAWVPARYAPYLGAGAGAMWYRYRQEGDFIDFLRPERPVFGTRMESSGWAPAVQGLAGVEYSLTPRLVLSGEARYVWAEAELGADFEGFDPIDLSGWAGVIGLSIRL